MIKEENNELEKAIVAINEDLCIISSNLKGRKIETLRKIRYSLAEKVEMPVDLLLYTSREFSERAKISSTFEYKILNEGVLVHGS